MAIAASRFNEAIVVRLVDGALDGLRRHGVEPEAIDVAWAPGAFELPVVASRLAASGLYDSGDHPRGGYSGRDRPLRPGGRPVAAGRPRAPLDAGVPIVFGVLTTDTIEQAVERSGTKAGNKGFEAAADRHRDGQPAGPLPK